MSLDKDDLKENKNLQLAHTIRIYNNEDQYITLSYDVIEFNAFKIAP
ncbi:hypothetical protein HYD64_02255 [Mycoplasmopsis bovis]|nr:hypothetical protein [Mycoplasmopsis bovis]QQH60188.1 hypothetical protein HYD64_02255 [Mycoplasmopsis bovis]